jgi:two-component system KDP operon response regulator KdpE
VLVIDGEWNARRATIAALRYGGFESDTARSVKDAGRRLRRRRYSGIIVDPGVESAAAVVAQLRARTDLPIIVVTEVDDRDHLVQCLDAGADDHMVRPVDPEELLARFRAVLRRTSPVEDQPPVVTDDFVIELADRRIIGSDGSEIQLSPIEWKIVETLVHRAGHLVTREELLCSVWGPDAVAKTQYLRVHMASIRQKLEPDHTHPRYFFTAPGLGLKFEASHSSPDGPNLSRSSSPATTAS